MKSFELRTPDMRKLLAAVAVWYFVIQWGGPLQVGPFATEAACGNFSTLLGTVYEIPTTSCFSTTAKQ